MTSIRGLRALLAVVAAFVLAPGAAHAATITSTASGDWSDPATWAGGVVPDTPDTAVVHTGHSVTLPGDVSVDGLTIEGGGNLDLDGHSFTTSADATLGGDYYSTSWLSDGTLNVGGKLLVQNTAVTNVVVVVTGTTEFSGPLPGDDEASSFWQNSTFTQSFGGVTLSGHTFTGALNPVLDDANLTVRGVNDLGSALLTLTGWGGVYFEPTALTGIGGAPMLSVGALAVSGVHQTTMDWSGLSNLADGDRVNLVAAPGGDATDLIYQSNSISTFGGPLTGEQLYVTYIGNPRPAANPLPSLTSSSALAGHAEVGDTLTCAPGTWTPDGTKVYSWTSDGSPIGGATSSTFVVTSGERGTDVKCTVAVTAVGVTGTEDSNAVRVDVAPGNITEPEPTSANADPGKASVGDVLTCDEGLWSAVAPTYAYAWERDGATINGATARTYTTVSADGGTDITCSVVATDGLASSSAVQSVTAVEVAGGPVATTPPTATSTRTPSDSATTGDVLTCDPGVWNPDGPKVYTWKRDGGTIGGATSATYTVVPADLTTEVTCSVSVTVAGQSGSADSAAVSVIAAPANSVAPSITGAVVTGTSTPGVQLTCGAGTWSGSPSYAYAWKRGATTVATGSSYTPGNVDVGNTLTCEVTATTSGIAGTPATSTGVAIAFVPLNTVAPSITGTPVAGKSRAGLTLTCAPGTWSESPTYTYAWQRNGVATGVTTATFTPVGGDVGDTFTCAVTAAASGLTSSAVTSAGVEVVATAENTVAPSITGTPAAGKTTPGVALTCDAGTWTLIPALDYAWKRGSTTVATTSAYTPVAADAGNTLTCAVTGTANGVPSAAVSTGGVAVLPDPDNTAAPTLTGSGTVGEALTCATGSWAGSPDLFVRWLRGQEVVAAGSTVYTVVRADRNAELRCKVTATTLGVERTASSAPVTAKAAAPITIDERPEAVVTTRSVRVAYTLAPDVTVTGCTLNGAALASCASPIVVDSLASRADYSLVLSLHNEYGEDETRTVTFATQIAGPSVSITNWKSTAYSYKWVTLKFAVGAGASVACTFDGQPLACTPVGAQFVAPRSGEHVFEVTATDAYGQTAADRRTLEIKDKGLLVPKLVQVAAGDTMIIPAAVDLREYRLEGLGATAVGTEGNWGLRFKAPTKVYGPEDKDEEGDVPSNRYKLRVFAPNGDVVGATLVQVTASEAVIVDQQAGGVIDTDSPVTCPKGTPGSVYLWYIDDKLVRTDASNAFPAKLLPKNGTVSCAVNDPETGLTPPLKILLADGVRLGASINSADNVSLAISRTSPIRIIVERMHATFAESSKVKPKAKYTRVQTINKQVRKGWTRVSLGRKLPKSGYRITIKIKKGKRFSKPLVLSKG